MEERSLKELENKIITEYIRQKYPFFKYETYTRFLENKQKYEKYVQENYVNPKNIKLPNSIKRKNGLYNLVENVRILAQKIIAKAKHEQDKYQLSLETVSLLILTNVVLKNGWKYPTLKNMKNMEV